MSKFILSIAMVFSTTAFAAVDRNVCATLGTVIAHNIERLSQAEAALGAADFLCAERPDPAQCRKDLEADYKKAAESLEKARKAYFDAGCEE